MLFTRVHTAFPRVARRKSGTAQGPTTGALLPGHIECDQVSRRSSTVTVRQILPLRRVLPGCFCDILSPRTACTSKKNPACMQARCRHAGTLHACSPEACLPGGAQNAAHIETKCIVQAGKRCMHACSHDAGTMHARAPQACRHDAHMQTRCMRARWCREGGGVQQSPLDLTTVALVWTHRAAVPPWTRGGATPPHTQAHPKRSR